MPNSHVNNSEVVRCNASVTRTRRQLGAGDSLVGGSESTAATCQDQQEQGRKEFLRREHNVETVPRIFKRIRPAFRYERSLEVITRAREAGLVTKSNLILGLGEERAEVSQALRDLHEAGCELITITQYLRPSVRHHPVERWVKPEEFVELKEEAEQIGFAGVMSGPLVRSSYRAGRLYAQAKQARGEDLPENLQHLLTVSASQEITSLLAPR